MEENQSYKNPNCIRWLGSYHICNNERIQHKGLKRKTREQQPSFLRTDARTISIDSYVIVLNTVDIHIIGFFLEK